MQQTTNDASSSATTASKDVDDDPRTADRPANEERHALKRTYLTLLPHTQLVELCLAFEAYSPLHVKTSLWPTNLSVAVAELQSAPLPPSSQPTKKDVVSGPATNVAPPSDPFPPDAPAQSSSPTGALVTNAIIDQQLPLDNTNSHATATIDEPSRLQQPRTSEDTSQPTPQADPSTHFATPAVSASSQGPYPPASYGHPPTQSLPAYPHTPYYPPLGYAHSFPPQSSPPYPHAGFPPFPPPHGSGPPFPAVPLVRHPHSMGSSSTEHSGIPADDLPSYEDMLVEAITDLNEADGSAPKSLFTWMASRYPLHTNFRPSASQALQKAFKRGRLEKGSNGKYRLNASWDGGSTSKRTTRRPQSFAQMVLPASHAPPTTSPFTHAPLSQPARGALVHNPSMPAPISGQEKNPQYPPYPFQYPPGVAYPGYGLSPPPPPPQVSKGASVAEKQPVAAVTDAPARTAPGESEEVNEEVGEGSDAWEAAQAILKAINFGSLLQVTAAKAAPVRQPSPPTVHAGSAFERAPASDEPPDVAAVAGSVLSDRDRASLQAQLALLAAQLAEIAEDTIANDLNATDEDAGAEEGNGTAGEEDNMEGVDVP